MKVFFGPLRTWSILWNKLHDDLKFLDRRKWYYSQEELDSNMIVCVFSLDNHFRIITAILESGSCPSFVCARSLDNKPSVYFSLILILSSLSNCWGTDLSPHQIHFQIKLHLFSTPSSFHWHNPQSFCLNKFQLM